MTVRVVGSLLALLAIFIAGIGWFALALMEQGPRLTRTADSVARVSRVSVPMLMAAEELKSDAIQVQQWFTDVSTARNSDGLTAGYAMVRHHAERFKFHLGEARRHARFAAMGEIDEILERLSEAFEEYHRIGTRMADAVVAKDTETASRLMEEVETAAEHLLATADRAVAMTQITTFVDLERMRAEAAAVEHATRSLFVTLKLGAVAFAVVVGIAILFVLRVFSGEMRRLDRAILRRLLD